jgi:hypothetical protein
MTTLGGMHHRTHNTWRYTHSLLAHGRRTMYHLFF